MKGIFARYKSTAMDVPQNSTDPRPIYSIGARKAGLIRGCIKKKADAVALWFLRWRLAAFRPGAPDCNRFAEAVCNILNAELARRSASYQGWERELAERETVAAWRQIRAEALDRFSRLASSPDSRGLPQ